MARIIRPESRILHLNIDMILTILSMLLVDNFNDFANFFRIWAIYQTQEQIDIVLRNINWSEMYRHENRWHKSAFNKFSAFIHRCKDRGIDHAMCYDACRNLLQGEAIDNNLNTLRELSPNHSLSFLGYHVFNSIYKERFLQESARSIHSKLKTLHFRNEFPNLVSNLQNYNKVMRSGGWNPLPRFTPSKGICLLGKTKVQGHFNIYSWTPTIDDIIGTTCPICCLQMIWFEIFNEY